MQDILNKLNEKTKKSFEKAVEALNVNVKTCEKDGDMYKRPMPVLADGGCTVNYGKAPDTLVDPAVVTFGLVSVLPCLTVYRVAFNIEDAAKAAEDNVYFNTVFIPILNEAIHRYKLTFGDEHVIRYGSYFLKLSDYLDINGEYVEIRLHGNWASDKVVQ